MSSKVQINSREQQKRPWFLKKILKKESAAQPEPLIQNIHETIEKFNRSEQISLEKQIVEQLYQYGDNLLENEYEAYHRVHSGVKQHGQVQSQSQGQRNFFFTEEVENPREGIKKQVKKTAGKHCYKDDQVKNCFKQSEFIFEKQDFDLL